MCRRTGYIASAKPTVLMDFLPYASLQVWVLPTRCCFMSDSLEDLLPGIVTP